MRAVRVRDVRNISTQLNNNWKLIKKLLIMDNSTQNQKLDAREQARRIAGLKASDVIRDEYVRQQFIYVFNAIWKEGGEGAYEREAAYFAQYLRDNERLRKSTGTSVFFAFIDLAIRGLTLEQGAQGTCYLLPRGAKISTPEGERWETRCNLAISGYGELVLRAKAGQIHHADNPVVVYEGDEFSYGEKDGHKYVNYCCRLPRTSERIVACFIKITRCDGSTDYSVMTEGDWKRLENYSARNNSYVDKNTGQLVEKANSLYNVNGQIDKGFLMAKCIKHAFKSYPKIPIGKGTVFESDVIDQPDTSFDPYGGIDTGSQSSSADKETFACAQDMSAGVTFNSPASGEDDTF